MSFYTEYNISETALRRENEPPAPDTSKSGGTGLRRGG